MSAFSRTLATIPESDMTLQYGSMVMYNMVWYQHPTVRGGKVRKTSHDRANNEIAKSCGNVRILSIAMRVRRVPPSDFHRFLFTLIFFTLVQSESMRRLATTIFFFKGPIIRFLTLVMIRASDISAKLERHVKMCVC